MAVDNLLLELPIGMCMHMITVHVKENVTTQFSDILKNKYSILDTECYL